MVIVAATLALATAALPPGSNGLGYIWCPMDCLSDDVALPVGSGPSILLPMSDLVATFPELMERKTRGSSLSWTEAISLREPSPKLRLVLELFAAQRRIFDAQTLPLLKGIGRRLPHLTPNEAIGHQQFCPNPSILDNFNCILHADYPPPAISTANDILSTPATVMLDSLLDSVGVVAMMVDTLPVTIMPALYAELVRAAGGTRALYGPYLAVMADFIRKVVGLGVMVVTMGGTNRGLFQSSLSTCAPPLGELHAYGPHFCAGQYHGWKTPHLLLLLEMICLGVHHTPLPPAVASRLQSKNLEVVMAAAGVDAKTAQAMLAGDYRLCIVSEARIRRVFGIPDALAAYLEGRHSVIFLPPDEAVLELRTLLDCSLAELLRCLSLLFATPAAIRAVATVCPLLTIESP